MPYLCSDAYLDALAHSSQLSTGDSAAAWLPCLAAVYAHGCTQLCNMRFVSCAQVCELAYSKATSNPARWVLAVPEDSNVQDAADLAGTIIASELVETTRRYFAERGIPVKKARPEPQSTCPLP